MSTPQTVALPIADAALLAERTLVRYHFPEDELEELEQLCRQLKEVCNDQISCRFAACPEKTDRLAASMTLGKGPDELQEALQKQDMLLESYMVETLAGEALMEAYSRFHEEIHQRTGWFVKQMSFLGSSSEPIEQLPELLKILDYNGQCGGAACGTTTACADDAAPAAVEGKAATARVNEAPPASCAAAHITCNDRFCLIPKKSVVFWAELTKETVRCAGVCDCCENVQCPNRIPGNQEAAEKMESATAKIRWPDLFGRPLPYGYDRIFGR